jgi:hypothetical protein
VKSRVSIYIYYLRVLCLIHDSYIYYMNNCTLNEALLLYTNCTYEKDFNEETSQPYVNFLFRQIKSQSLLALPCLALPCLAMYDISV